MLSAVNRLVDSSDHRLVARRGRKGRSGPVVVSIVRTAVTTAAPPADAAARAAVVVPRRVGSSPVRNTMQRRMRHLLRDRIAALPAGSLAVVRLEPGAGGLTSAELARHLDRGLEAALSGPGRGRV